MKRMKWMLAMLLLCACLTGAVAHAEDGHVGVPLTMQELNQWFDSVWQEAKEEPLLNDPNETLNEESNMFLIQTEPFTLECVAPTLEQSSNPINTVTFNEGEMVDPRGIGLGTSLEQLLLAYPNANVPLVGDDEFAALYVYGLGEIQNLNEAGWAWVLREKARITSVQYAVHAPAADGQFTDAGIQYVIEDGYVSDMRVYGRFATIDQEEMQANLDIVRDIAKRDTYTPTQEDVLAMRADTFGVADLVFSDFDFLHATADSVWQRFGKPDSQEMAPGEGGTPGRANFYYEGMQFTFSLDAMNNPTTLESMLINRPNLAGPRGIVLGMDLVDVLGTFRQEEQTERENNIILYSEGKTLDQPPFGMVNYFGTSGATVRYATMIAPGESGEAVTLHLSIENMAVSEMLIYRWTPDEVK